MPRPALQREDRLPVVLVIDDNPAIRDMVSWALELDGYEPAEATEGQEALDWMSNASHDGRYPSVILLDLAMPGMDGSTFLACLQQHWQAHFSAIPLPAVVVITARASLSSASALGVDQVIVKPFHVRDLLNAVRLLVK